jgi:hypothetical protein
MVRAVKTVKAVRSRADLRRSPVTSSDLHRSNLTVFAVLTAFTVLSPLSVLPVPLHAQTTAAGRVLRPDARDTLALPGVRVLLHRVGRERQGPVDSVLSDSRGHFRFVFRSDTGSLYLLSARYGGIEYFSSPVHTNPARPDSAIPLLVYDTSSRAPVGVEAHHIVVPRPGDDGSRSVLELFVLRNSALRARVGADSLQPVWSAPLPAGSLGLQVGESDLSPDAVSRQGDSVYVFAPIAPGEKQLAVQYVIPGEQNVVNFPMGTSAGQVNLLIEGPVGGVSGAPLALADSQLIEGRMFQRWSGTVSPGAVIRVALTGSRRTPVALLAGLVAGLALALLLAGWRLVARSRARPESPLPEGLLASIASLDVRYLGRESEVPVNEWETYRAERARLKAELDASLAARDHRR